MNRVDSTYRQEAIRTWVITILMLAYIGLGVYFRVGLRTPVVYTHFAYIPIVLAGLWWGRKSIGIALILVGVTFFLRFLGSAEGGLWSDIARGSFFLIIASCIGILSEKVMNAQRALTASEQKYKLLIDNSLAGIFVHRDYEIVFLNQRFCEILGYTTQELLGKSIKDFIYHTDARKCSELISSRRESEFSRVHHECRFVSKDKKIIWVDLASSMTKYEDEPAVLVNVYDITARKEAEENRQELLELSQRQQEQLVHSNRLAELGEMAASIAHEINQPLTAVRNFATNTAYMIETDTGGQDEIRNNLRRIVEQVDRASTIINQMRTLTRKSERQVSLLDINTVLRESIDFMNLQFKLKGIEVSLELADGLPSVMGDKIRLQQVFLNIMTNAVQAMEESAERRLEVKTYMDRLSNHPLLIEITDSGRGFTADVAEKIFSPFFSTKKPGEGTGLGLPISLAIVKEHGGEIEAIGAPGIGSIFKVMLPLTGPAEGHGIRKNDRISQIH